MALSALENPAYAGAIEKAKQYLLSVQYRDDEENANAGGPGYNVGGRTSGDLRRLRQNRSGRHVSVPRLPCRRP